MMDLVEVEKPENVTDRAFQSNTVADPSLADLAPSFRRERLQLCRVPAGRVLKALKYFREAWMRITNYVTGGLQEHIDTHIKPSNDRPCRLARRRRPFMRPIAEFVVRNCSQDVPGEVVLNCETVPVEIEGTGSGAIRHCSSRESIDSAP